MSVDVKESTQIIIGAIAKTLLHIIEKIGPLGVEIIAQMPLTIGSNLPLVVKDKKEIEECYRVLFEHLLSLSKTIEDNKHLWGKMPVEEFFDTLLLYRGNLRSDDAEIYVTPAYERMMKEKEQ